MATNFNFGPKVAAKPAGAKPPAGAAKPAGAKPAGFKPAGAKPAIGLQSVSNGANPPRALSPTNASRGSVGATSPRAPLEHKNSQVGFNKESAKAKAQYGTIIRNWGNQSASKANLSMLEKKNLTPLVNLHRNNNVKVQSVTSEVIDGLLELPDGSLSMDPSKGNGFRPLIDLCKRDDIDAEVPVLVVQSLAYLAAHPACREPIMNEIGWININKFARVPEGDMKMACALLLGNLSREAKNQKVMIEKGVPLLMENLKEAKDSNLKSALYGSFAFISRIKEYGAQGMWDTNLLQYVIPSIMNDANHDEQQSAISLLCNISDTPNVSVHEEVVTAGILDKLYTMLQNNADEDLQSNIALSIARIGRSSVGWQKLSSFPSFKNLLDKLTSKNSATLFQVLGALDVLVDHEAIRHVLKKEDAVEYLQDIILSTTVHAQVEEIALKVLKKLDSEQGNIVADKLSHTQKARDPNEVVIVDGQEETLSFSPRSTQIKQEVPKPSAPTAKRRTTDASTRTSEPLKSFSNSGVDIDRVQKDHSMEVQRLLEDKKRLEEQLKKQREAEIESSRYHAASTGNNIDDKIKDSLKSMHDNVTLEVDLLFDENRKIEDWKRAIENHKTEKIAYEKDVENLHKNREQLDKERVTQATDLKLLGHEKDKLEQDKIHVRAEHDRVTSETARLKHEADDVVKARAKLENERKEFDKERELLTKGQTDQSSIDKERFEREKRRAQEAEEAKELAEKEFAKVAKEKIELMEVLESERHKSKLEKQQMEEERERSAATVNVGAEDKLRAFEEKERHYEEINLKFERQNKQLERDKAILEEELTKLRESTEQNADESKSNALEERQKNAILQARVEELEAELRNKHTDHDRGDEQLAQLQEEKDRLEEMVKKLQADLEEFERSKRNNNGGEEDEDLDLDERERKQLKEDLKKIEEWERAKERDKEESKKKLDEEIELLRMRHASWERKKAIDMADLIAKEKEVFEREGKLQKMDDDLYKREVSVADLEGRPKRKVEYPSSDESADRTNMTRSDEEDEDEGSYSDEDYFSDERTEDNRSGSDSDYTIDSPRRKRRSYKDVNRDKEREQDRDRERERERDRERERERDREERDREDRERERQRQREREYDQDRRRDKERERKVEKSRSPNLLSPASLKSEMRSSPGGMRGSVGLKGSNGIRNSPGLKNSGKMSATPKPRPPFADYIDGMEDGEYEEDEDDILSVEGLAHSDPYEAARKLLSFLELDPSRAIESTMETVRKFAKNRSGAPIQFEAREIIPALVQILRVCPGAAYEEIINICLLILAILAYNKDANQLYIRRAKGYDYFEIYLSLNVPSVQARVCLTIAAYCLNNIPVKNEIGPTAVPKIVPMLKSEDPIIRQAAATALAALVDGNKYNKKQVKILDGIKILLELLKDNQIPPKYSLHLLSALAHDSKKIKIQVPKLFPTVFRKIVLLLSPYTKAGVLAAAVAALVELVRNNLPNQKAIYKAGATNYLVTILVSKDRYNNDDLIANALYLCWVIAKIAPKGLASAEFETEKYSMADVLKNLKEVNNEAVKKIIFNMENMIRTTDAAKGVIVNNSRPARTPSSRLSASPFPASPSPFRSSSSNPIPAYESPALSSPGTASPGPSSSASPGASRLSFSPQSSSPAPK